MALITRKIAQTLINEANEFFEKNPNEDKFKSKLPRGTETLWFVHKLGAKADIDNDRFITIYRS